MKKKKLIILRDFGLNSIYSIFDSNSLGFSNESDFMKALKCFGIKTTKEEVILLFKHYSKDYNKRLSYSEISKIFLPYLENNAISSQELEPETKKKIKNLLEKHLKNEASIEKYRQQMNKKVSPEEIFKNLRCENIGEVLLQKILSLDLGRVLNEKEIYWIFDTFKSSDSLISLKNFREELLPKSRKKY